MGEQKKILVYLFSTIVMVVLVLFLPPDRGKSQTLLPGKGPINTEADATAIGRSIAIAELAENARANQIVHMSTRRIAAIDYGEEVEKLGIGANSTVVQAQTGDVWLVTFTGSFSTKRGPAGWKSPVFSKLAIYLDATTGNVLGVGMGK
jgi:hypothetical protein